jgi:uncharacterized protein YqiB (DUF1249 family)
MKAKLYDDNRVVEIVDCNDVDRICNSCDRNSCYVEVHMRDHTKLCDDFVFMLEGEED